MPVSDAVRTRARPTLFFIAAAIHAAIAVPLWVVSYADIRSTDLTAAWHGGEMLFGYAYAVFGGFFLTRTSAPMLLSLLAIWLVSRILALTPDFPSTAAIILMPLYPLLLFGYAVWPFLKAVRRWRNAVFAPVLATLFAAALLHGLGAVERAPAGQGSLLAFDLILVMLFTMGGRFTAAAVSGALQRKGARLHKPAQPGLERAGILCLVGAAVSDQITPYGPVTAMFAAFAMVVMFARLWRWRAWRALDRPEVAFLLLGYLWLGMGLGARAFAGATGAIVPVEADHVLAVGALGTLSMTVMARVARQRCGYPVVFGRWLVVALGLISAAAVLRSLAGIGFDRDALLIGAGVCWSAAFLIFASELAVLWRGARPRARRRISS
jgi:uncharacterized protein involved in response to NO